MKRTSSKSWRYIINLLKFVCGSSRSTKRLGQDEETKARPSGIVQEEEMQTKEPQELKRGG
jgi:hypothetical protein